MKSLALGLFVLLAACSFTTDSDAKGTEIAAQGSGAARTFQVAGFTAIALRGSDDIDVRVGTGFSVRAEGAPDDLDTLRVSLDGEMLQVGRKSGVGMPWSRGAPVKVFVTLPRLTEADVAGSGDMTIDRVEGARFAAGIAGSGDLRIAAMQVDEAAFSIAGTGDVRAAGTAKALKIEIAGTGDVDGSKLRAQSASVEIAGTGSAVALVDGPAKVNSIGTGDVDLGPNAHCTVSKLGTGTVRCAR